MRVKQLIELADRAKTAGYAAIANIICAVLIHRACFSSDVPQGSVPNLWFEWETQSLMGAEVDDAAIAAAFYDLVIIAHKSDEGVLELCIPVTFLQPDVAMQIVNRATFRQRGFHDRWIDDEDDHIADVWRLLGKEVNARIATEAINAVFKEQNGYGEYFREELLHLVAEYLHTPKK